MTTKERFLKTPAAKNLANIIASDDFQAMLICAFDYFVENRATASTDQNRAASANYRIEGAREFRQMLNTFCLSDIQPIDPNAAKSLNHELK